MNFWLFTTGYLTIEDIEITLELNRTSIQLNITCITTGEPATNVTWTRESDTVTEGIETVSVLDDRVTAQYTHTLTATEKISNFFTYICEVSNNKPSLAAVHVQISSFPGFGMLLYLHVTHIHFEASYIVCFLGDNLNHPLCISHVYIHHTIPAPASYLPLSD